MSDEMDFDLFIELWHKKQRHDAAIRRKNELEAIRLQNEAELKYPDLFEAVRYREAIRQKAMEKQQILTQTTTNQR
jgi:hypothetical protein